MFEPGSAHFHFVINVVSNNNNNDNKIHIKNVNDAMHFIYSHTYNTNSAEGSSNNYELNIIQSITYYDTTKHI